MPFQVALVIGFSVRLAAHFALQRWFLRTSSKSYALPIHHQAWRNLGVAAAQYVVTSLAKWYLPGLLGVDVTYVYVTTVVLVTMTNFVIFGRRVFHPPRDATAD